MTTREEVRQQAVQRFEKAILDLATYISEREKRPKMKEYNAWRTHTEGINHVDYFSPVEIETIVGDWNRALDLAEEEGVTREIALQEVEETSRKISRIPSREEWDRFGEFPQMSVVDSLFNSWDAVAVEVSDRTGLEWETREEERAREREEMENRTFVTETDDYGRRVHRELTEEEIEEREREEEDKLTWVDI